jgi:hypothetical protein
MADPIVELAHKNEVHFLDILNHLKEQDGFPVGGPQYTLITGAPLCTHDEHGNT